MHFVEIRRFLLLLLVKLIKRTNNVLLKLSVNISFIRYHKIRLTLLVTLYYKSDKGCKVLIVGK